MFNFIVTSESVSDAAFSLPLASSVSLKPIGDSDIMGYVVPDAFTVLSPVIDTDFPLIPTFPPVAVTVEFLIATDDSPMTPDIKAPLLLFIVIPMTAPPSIVTLFPVIPVAESPPSISILRLPPPQTVISLSQ